MRARTNNGSANERHDDDDRPSVIFPFVNENTFVLRTCIAVLYEIFEGRNFFSHFYDAHLNLSRFISDRFRDPRC